MEEMRMKVSGFVDATDEELAVCGGMNPDTIRKIAKILGIIVDFVMSYGEDFYKGYKKGVEGKPLFVFNVR